VDSKFNPPINKQEFVERAQKTTAEGAKGVLSALRSRRAMVVRPYDVEIQYYEQVLKLLETGDAEWPIANSKESV
jgi:hypothetical protein